MFFKFGTGSVLTSLQNSLIKQIRKLHHPKGRAEQQLFLLEGTHLLEEACALKWPLMAVCYTAEWQQKHEHLLQQVCALAQRCELVSPNLLAAIATTTQPDGVVATACRRTCAVNLTSLGLVLETIQDPGNLGTMIRTATAAGAEGLLLSSDSVDLEHPKVLRASAGQWFRLPMAMVPDLDTELRRYQQQGIQLIATQPDAPLSYWELDLRLPSLILLGNEGAGLSATLSQIADRSVKIPLSRGVESLNVAIAAALILYEAQRQRTFEV